MPKKNNYAFMINQHEDEALTLRLIEDRPSAGRLLDLINYAHYQYSMDNDRGNEMVWFLTIQAILASWRVRKKRDRR